MISTIQCTLFWYSISFKILPINLHFVSYLTEMSGITITAISFLFWSIADHAQNVHKRYRRRKETKYRYNVRWFNKKKKEVVSIGSMEYGFVKWKLQIMQSNEMEFFHLLSNNQFASCILLVHDGSSHTTMVVVTQQQAPTIRFFPTCARIM